MHSINTDIQWQDATGVTIFLFMIRSFRTALSLNANIYAAAIQ